MDSSDVTNERSENFADATYDSDLEARLYAEIYYSNDTYTGDCRSAEGEIPDSADPRNPTSASLDEESHSSTADIPQAGSFSVRSVTPVRERTDDGVQAFEAPDLSDCVNGHDKYRYARRVFPKRCRLLARENLWSEKNARSSAPVIREASAGNLQPDAREQSPNEAVAAKTCDSTGATRNEEIDGVGRNDVEPEEPVPSKEKRPEAKKKTKHPFPTQQFRGTTGLRRKYNVVTRAKESRMASKYRVISKKTKLNMREANSEVAGVSSDSDDSILEVPVPPKAQPVVIQLVDSDDESAASEDSPEGNSAELARCNDEPSVGESSSGSMPIIGESTNVPSTADAGTADFDSGDLILNCTDERPGPSNAEKTGGAHRTGASSCMYSDDSMTESEANNWSNIAAGDANASRSHERSSADKAMDQSYGLLWDQLSLDNSTGPHPTKDTTGPIVNAATDGTTDVARDNVDAPSIDRGEEQTERNKRKRPKNSSVTSLDNSNVSEIPEKRSKGNESEACRSKSLVEYFFAPMSKELQAYYNEPCGKKNLDVCDIQKKMPQNPKYWTILDADLRPSPKRRGKVCPHCKDNAHFGKKCPEKPSQPICSMCGERGHVEIRCPQTMCLTCGHKYTSFRQTCNNCFKLACSMCNGMGHTLESCPDLWRRFHDITTETQPTARDLRKTMKSSRNLNCCNCASRGHDATMCKQLRWSQHFPTPMYVTSYTDGPIYPSLRQERIEDSNLDGQVVVRTTNDENDRRVDPPNSVAQGRVVYHITSWGYSKKAGCASLSSRLDTMKSCDLNGFLSGADKPHFLVTMTKRFTFGASIVHKIDNSVLLQIYGRDEDVVCGMNKLLMQWFSRSADEKTTLKYDLFEFENTEATRLKLKKKLLLLTNVPPPAKLLEVIDEYRRQLATTRGELRRAEHGERVSAGYLSSKKKNIRTTLRRMREEQGKLNLSLYTRALVNDNERLVHSFCDLANRVINTPSHTISVLEYADLLYLYNELFTFHASDAVMEALNKIESASVSAKPAIPSLFALNVPPPATNPPAQAIERRDVQGQLTEVASGGGRPDDQPSACENGPDEGNLMTATQLTAAVVNGTEEHPPMSIGSDATEQCNANATSNEVATDKLDLQNAGGTLLLNCYRKVETTSDKRGRRRKKMGLLSDLSKKQRKLYRRSAREAIQLANKSHLSWLQKFAQSLTFKMNDGSVKTTDVKALQDAITRTLNTRKAKAKAYAGRRTTPQGKTRTQLGTFLNSSEFVTNAH